MFQELMQHLYAVQMSTLDDLLGDTWHEGDRVRTRYTLSQPNLYTLLFWRELWKYRSLVTASGCSVPLSLLPGPALTRAPKAQGRVTWVSLTPNMWCLSKQHSIPQTPPGYATAQFNSDRKSGEWIYILHVEVSELSSLQMPAMWAHPSWFDKVSKTGKFHYPTSMFNYSVNLMTKLRKTTHIGIAPCY